MAESRTPSQQILDKSMTEEDFQAQIVKLAETHGWHVWHDHDSRRNSEGLPDLLLLRGQMMLWFECKTERGVTSDGQSAFIRRLNLVKEVHADVVRPRHMDQIIDVLSKAKR